MPNDTFDQKNWFRTKLPRLLLLATAFFGFGALGAGWGAWRNLCVDCPSIARISTWEPQQTGKILSHDGRLVAEIGLERRTPVALEDRRFYSHHGPVGLGMGRDHLVNGPTNALSDPFRVSTGPASSLDLDGLL